MENKPVEVRSTTPDIEKYPDLGGFREVVLRDTQFVRKVGVFAEIRDRRTGEFHHNALTLKSWKKNKNRCTEDPQHSISLSSEQSDEIADLWLFLSAVLQGTISEPTGRHVVLSAKVLPNPKALQSFLDNVSADGHADALASVLEKAIRDESVFDAILKRASEDPEVFAESAAALNLALYRNCVEELTVLTERPGAQEADFQRLLTKYPWMFGSEYSELLDQKKFTRNEVQDFMMRRTSDGYIELIEIKTPLDSAQLFKFDQSHKSWYPCADLAKAIGQVVNYIDKLDTNRLNILHDDKEDTHKIRAKIVIGRDGDQDQITALRSFNGHLNRIEIITFDQLLCIAKRVLSYLESSLKRPEAPF